MKAQKESLHKYELGVFTRLRSPESPEYTALKKAMRGTGGSSDYHQFPHLTWANTAHTVMLAEQRIIPREDAVKILRELQDIDRFKYEEFMEQVTRLGLPKSLFTAQESYLIERLGEDVAGKMHTARSRGDLTNLLDRMALREKLFMAVEAITELRQGLLDYAAKHTETVMPGYTQEQHAQVTTLGHWMVFYADVFGRDIERLQDLYKRVNRNPLGGCAGSTTSFPIDRLRTTELMGFDGLIENSREAKDEHAYFIAESMNALALFFVNVSRMGQDWLSWYTSEYGMIDLPDEFCHSSSIMPQKKNPGLPQVMRMWAGVAIGDAAGCLATFKTPSDATLDSVWAIQFLWRHFEVLTLMCDCIVKMLASLEANKERMLELAGQFWATASELINTIYREKGISFRSAWRVVGRLIAMAYDEEVLPSRVTGEMLDRAAEEILGEPVGLSTDTVRKALDPVEFVRRHSVRGGPAPHEVQRMVKDRTGTVIPAEEEWLSEKRATLQHAREKLGRAIADLGLPK